MGDLVEFTTRMKCDIIFYKVNAGAILFSVKGDSNAVVGLSAEPNPYCVYWVQIGSNGYSYITKNHKNYGRVETPDILSIDEYRDFWLAWNDGKIRLGRKNQVKPILSNKIQEKNLSYVTFTSTMPIRDIHWKCLLPPQIEKPLVTKLTGGEPQWIPATDQLPDDALIGGYERETLYIIRAPHRGSLTPGKFVPSEGVGYIAWGSEACEKNEFEVLCGYNCIWERTSENVIPVGAVEAGSSENFEREKLYVGRAECDGHLIPGKVQPSHSVCYVPYNGKEVAKSNYEILVVPYANTRGTISNYVDDGGLDVQEIAASDSESDD